MLKCSFCMSSGLVNDFVLKVLFLGIGGLDVQFQCRLFFLVQALIFGAPVGFWEPSFVHYVCCLVALVGFSLRILGLRHITLPESEGARQCQPIHAGSLALLSSLGVGHDDQGPYSWNRDTEETRWQMDDGFLPRWWRSDGYLVDLGDN